MTDEHTSEGPNAGREPDAPGPGAGSGSDGPAPIPPSIPASPPALDPGAASAPMSVAGAEESPAAPIPVSDRIRSLDVMRGCALLGILFVNMLAFGLPIALYAGKPREGADTLDVAGWAFIRVGFQFKFIAIFSMLFGVGLAVQAFRAMQRGTNFTPVYLRRIGLLALIGLVHASVFWFGDILFVYAVVGVALLFVSRWSGKALLQMGAALLIAGTLWSASCIAGGQYMESAFAPAATESASATDTPTEPLDRARTPSETLEALNSVEWAFGAAEWNAAEIDAYRHGPIGSVMIFRGMAWFFIVISTIFSGLGVQLFGYFCLGAGLLRTGFFDPERPERAARFAMIGLPLGLGAEIGGTALVLTGGAESVAIGDFLHSMMSPVAALGWLGLITWLVSTGRSRGWDGLFAAAGRMALTVYLGETVISTAIFYWWGFGRFGQHGYAELVGMAIGVYLVLAIFAALWLTRFRMGPMEWLWRSATYGRWQPLVRSD